jgi:ryanodine receptor 2
MSPYTPTPIPTGHIILPAGLLALRERLAEHIHDVWAAERIAQGWTYGPTRDDAAKAHPCLVPYAALPEGEKEFDRNTALGALKAILALGYQITSPAGPPG